MNLEILKLMMDPDPHSWMITILMAHFQLYQSVIIFLQLLGMWVTVIMSSRFIPEVMMIWEAVLIWEI